MDATVRPMLMAVCALVWAAPFVVRRKRDRHQGSKVDIRARWGIVIVTIGFTLVNMHPPAVWTSELPVWRAVAAIAVTILSTGVAWSAVAHLGKQWRVDAGLNTDHELVQTGVYRYIRHPIYASMFGLLLMFIFLNGTFPGWVIGTAAFLIGTEIRVRVEDGLLRERFGERFIEWQRRVPAYIPFVR